MFRAVCVALALAAIMVVPAQAGDQVPVSAEPDSAEQEVEVTPSPSPDQTSAEADAVTLDDLHQDNQEIKDLLLMLTGTVAAAAGISFGYAAGSDLFKMWL